MSEIVEEYARKYAREYAKEYVEKEKIVSIQNLMKNMKLTLEQALNALEIQGDERGYNKTVTEIMSNYSIRESRHSAKIKVGLSTLFQTNFFRLFSRYCTGV